MRPSFIATTDHAVEPQSGAVLLGIVEGRHYWHVGPTHLPHRVFFPNGDLTNPVVLGPDDPAPDTNGMLAVQETPLPDWLDEAEVLYDPSPEPFRWEAFAEAYPDLAASPGEDEDGDALPPVLMPHQWAGE